MTTSPFNQHLFIVKSHLSPRMQDGFTGLTCTPETDGTTRIVGNLLDQAAVFGVLNTIQRLGLTLLTVQTLQMEDSDVE